jgi:hypothetical protein
MSLSKVSLLALCLLHPSLGLHGKNLEQQVLNTPPQVVLDTSDLEKI